LPERFCAKEKAQQAELSQETGQADGYQRNSFSLSAGATMPSYHPIHEAYWGNEEWKAPRLL